MMEIFLTISFGGRSGQNWEMWPLGLSVGLSQVTSFLQTVWWFCIPAATAAVTASLSFCSVPTSGEGLLHQLLTRSAAVGSTQTVMATCSNWGALQLGSVYRTGALGWIQTLCVSWHWVLQDPGTGSSGRNILSKLSRTRQGRPVQGIHRNNFQLSWSLVKPMSKVLISHRMSDMYLK